MAFYHRDIELLVYLSFPLAAGIVRGIDKLHTSVAFVNIGQVGAMQALCLIPVPDRPAGSICFKITVADDVGELLLSPTACNPAQVITIVVMVPDQRVAVNTQTFCLDCRNQPVSNPKVQASVISDNGTVFHLIPKGNVFKFL